MEWTDDEISVIEYFMNNACDINSTTKASDLLEYIKSESKYRKLFHAHHVMNTSRIRNGMDRVVQFQESKYREIII
jgi:hypothetical protein